MPAKSRAYEACMRRVYVFYLTYGMCVSLVVGDEGGHFGGYRRGTSKYFLTADHAALETTSMVLFML